MCVSQLLAVLHIARTHFHSPADGRERAGERARGPAMFLQRKLHWVRLWRTSRACPENVALVGRATQPAARVSRQHGDRWPASH